MQRDARAGRDAGAAVEAVWRIESARLIAGLARFCGDVGLAEELAQDAFVKALEVWPEEGVPDNPGAWLMTTAKNRGIDRMRRDQNFRKKVEEIGRDAEMRQAEAGSAADEAFKDHVGDDLLALVFTTCHPVLTPESQVALTLKLVGGLTTPEIARSFLVSDATVGQRISRAKKTLAEAHVPVETPGPDELTERLAGVLGVVYLIFNEGYSATAGEDWIRRDLCLEALRLGRVLQGLAPDEPEVHGLAALMEIQASRTNARIGPGGEAVLLMDQDRTKWDRLLIRRGLDALARADELGGTRGPFALQAAIAACHARALEADDTDWERIAALYEALAGETPTPVVELNRAVAVGMAYGTEAALEMVERLRDEPSLREYHLLPAVRGDLLEKLGRGDEAREEFARAAELTANERERAVLEARARGLTD